ncbi:hypothetical protein M3A96_08715 [Helcobacillus massiliensis]|uniref:hypothetical protein n=1 Tax=Helcobacillus massiliensis TaxID=521392 RepID=UPI0021A88550|nr:hypothetical protein [Helcobacillus massiliensis]MCT1558194.1 hypothetical protein [Helcobacillus massiliensis]MCT2036451.1 hypothetical protein [Helcobacillus massiliensis]MCT2332255.1 hypothetical protein [Helcobacillus massiliensis]
MTLPFPDSAPPSDGPAHLEAQQPVLDELFAHASSHAGGRDSLLDAMEFAGRFPTLSCYNASLVHLQRPRAQFVATRRTWTRDLHRTIRPGAIPLIVLRPFGPIDLMYDIADTDGPHPVPQSVLHPLRSLGPVTAAGAAQLVRLIEQAGGREHIAAVCAQAEEAEGIQGPTDPADLIAAVLRALAHALLGHLTPSTEPPVQVLRTVTPQGRRELGPRAQDFEADAVVALVLRRASVEHPSAAIPRADDAGLLAAVSPEAIFTAVKHIEALAGRRLLGEQLRAVPHQGDHPQLMPRGGSGKAGAAEVSPWDQPSLFDASGSAADPDTADLEAVDPEAEDASADSAGEPQDSEEPSGR